jgi:holo-[acyl-carrier protein] synthase
LGLGFREGLALSRIEITHDAFGKPSIAYLGKALELVCKIGITESLVSISDEQDYAVAFVILVAAKK